MILSKLAGYSVYGRVDGGGRGDQAGHTGGGILGVGLSLVGYEADRIVKRI